MTIGAEIVNQFYFMSCDIGLENNKATKLIYCTASKSSDNINLAAVKLVRALILSQTKHCEISLVSIQIIKRRNGS